QWDRDIFAILDDLLPSRGPRLVAMLKAFLDRGARPDAEGVMCVAACLFKPSKYKQFVRRWERMLDDIIPGGAPFFHATDFFPGGGIYKPVPKQKREAIAAILPDLLDEYLY